MFNRLVFFVPGKNIMHANSCGICTIDGAKKSITFQPNLGVALKS